MSSSETYSPVSHVTTPRKGAKIFKFPAHVWGDPWTSVGDNDDRNLRATYENAGGMGGGGKYASDARGLLEVLREIFGQK